MSTYVDKHYTRSNLLMHIQDALASINRSPESLTVEELAPLDEFHVGGRIATKSILDQLNITSEHQVLDIGCGLGGAARFTASHYQATVIGLDLTPSFIEAGRVLTRWVGLEDRVRLEVGNALSLPFPSGSIDRVYMLHVGMNVQNKTDLFSEIARVVKRGGMLGVYDICQMEGHELTYPVPWATDASMNYASTMSSYQEALDLSGFEVVGLQNKRDFALDFYQQLKEKMQESGTPALGLHLLMGDQTQIKIKNMIQGLTDGALSPVEWVCQKS